MKTQIIVNPESGTRHLKSVEKKIRDELSGLSPDLVYTSGPGHATELARSASARGVRTVVAVGGDGIVNEVLNGIAGTGATLGIIPTGTANDLARHLGISRDIDASCHLIRSGSTRRIDTIEVNGRRFLTVGGIGLGCDIARTAERIKKRRSGGRAPWSVSGSGLYLFAALVALAKIRRETRTLCLQIDGRWMIADLLWLTVSNQPKVGGHFLVSPEAKNDDGYFDLCMVENTRSRLKALSTVAGTLAGKHNGMRGVSVFRSREMTIQASEPLPFFGDGEILCESSQLRIRIRPSSVRILVPGPGYGLIRHPRDARVRGGAEGRGNRETGA